MTTSLMICRRVTCSPIVKGIAILTCSLTVIASSTLYAQGADGINVGETVSKVIPELMAREREIMMRRVLILPPEKQFSISDTLITLTLRNSSNDTLEASLKLYSVPPPQLIAPRSSGSEEEESRRVPSLIDRKQESTSEKTYKDLTPWISEFPKKVIIPPGALTDIEVRVKLPKDAKGEYAAWIATHVIVPESKSTVVQDEVTSGSQSVAFKVEFEGLTKPGSVLVGSTKIEYSVK